MADAMVFDGVLKWALRMATAYVGNNMHVDLFTDNHVLARDDVIGDFTLASYPGYAQFIWTTEPVVIDGSDRAVAVPALASFSAPTSGGDVVVYGWVAQYMDGFAGSYQAYGGALFLGGPITLHVGDPDLTFGLASRAFDAH